VEGFKFNVYKVENGRKIFVCSKYSDQNGNVERFEVEPGKYVVEEELTEEQAENYRIDIKTAKKLRESADENGSISDSILLEIIAGVPEDKPKPKSVKISDEIFSRYFGENTKKQEVTDTIEKALAYYFANREDL
jgi:pimeloyl-CoA synthetase